MIIGITGNKENGKNLISNFFVQGYSFEYFDVDKILKKILKEKYYTTNSENRKWNQDTLLLLKIRSEIDEEINKIITENPEKIIVLDYSLLEDSFIFDKCDLVIKTEFSHSNKFADEIETLRKYRVDSVSNDYNNSKYHLKLDLAGDWESKLKEYIDYNVYNKTKVTVVVPIYNTIDYLSRCVNSITNQTYRNLEILLIDDGSTDESLKLCNLLAEKDERIKVIHQDNAGLSETRNKGMEMATGEYICFFDSDDYIENTMIETLLKTAEKTNADVCESSFFIHMKDGTVKDVTCEQRGIKFVEGKLNLINAYSDANILIPAWDKLYKLDAIRDIKFDKNCFKEDSDYIYRLCLAERTFALVDIPFYHYVKRKSVSITGNKISPKLFTLKEWGINAYNRTLAEGEEYRDAAEKILYNSLVHILRNYIRDYKNGVLVKGEYQEEIQGVVNDIISLLLQANNVSKFRKLDEVLSIINKLIDDEVLDKDKMPSIELPCVGVLWNSLNEDMMNEALAFINEYATINECIYVDLQDKYREFINEIYKYNQEFEGIPVFKSSTLIDKYESNTIAVLNLIIKVTNYIYFNRQKGFMFEEVASLKSFIRKYFKPKIYDYAYDNIFHLTVDNEEYTYTDGVCRKFIKDYRGNKNDKD